MSKKIPHDIAKEIKEFVFQEADRINYLSRTRKDNGTFLDQLVLMQEVGGRLNMYMRQAEIRTYIKDAILNRYSKDKTQEERPSELSTIIKERLGMDVFLVECESKTQINLFKSPANCCFIVVADGTFLKWETALKKALMYIASKPFVDQSDMHVNIILTLFARYQKISPSSIHYLEKALLFCNAIPYIYGEG